MKKITIGRLSDIEIYIINAETNIFKIIKNGEYCDLFINTDEQISEKTILSYLNVYKDDIKNDEYYWHKKYPIIFRNDIIKNLLNNSNKTL